MKKCKPQNTAFENFVFVVSFLFLALPPLFTAKTTDPLQPYAALPFYQLLMRMLFFVLYEEVFYRVYFPYAGKHFLFSVISFKSKTDILQDSSHRFIRIFSEGFSVLLFALAHSYRGIFAVIYALICGAVFRFVFCVLKNKYCALPVICLLHLANNLFYVMHAG